MERLIVTPISKTYGLNKEASKVFTSLKDFVDCVKTKEFMEDLDYIEVQVCDEYGVLYNLKSID